MFGAVTCRSALGSQRAVLVSAPTWAGAGPPHLPTGAGARATRPSCSCADACGTHSTLVDAVWHDGAIQWGYDSEADVHPAGACSVMAWWYASFSV